MEHARAQGLLEGYFAGKLDRDTVRELHGHFKDCQECRSRIRLTRAGLRSGRAEAGRDPLSPEIQAAIARNRDLLVKILLLIVFAWFVWKFRR